MKLEGSRIVLTGAASGIGFALLDRLAGIPCQIVAADLSEEALRTAVGRLVSPAAHITPFVGDLGDEHAVNALFDRAGVAMGGIDIFIANAGFAYYEAFGPTTWEHIERIQRVNVTSPLYSVGRMQALHAGDDADFMVVITCSAMGRLGLAGYALYSATKAALDRFAEAYRAERPRGHLLLAYPISTRTRFFNSSQSRVETPLFPPTQSAETVAAAILAGIERDARSVFPSRLFRVTAFFNRFLPLLSLSKRIAQRQFLDWQSRSRAQQGS
jgi:short-subunit dehydrogenase